MRVRKSSASFDFRIGDAGFPLKTTATGNCSGV